MVRKQDKERSGVSGQSSWVLLDLDLDLDAYLHVESRLSISLLFFFSEPAGFVYIWCVRDAMYQTRMNDHDRIINIAHWWYSGGYVIKEMWIQPRS